MMKLWLRMFVEFYNRFVMDTKWLIREGGHEMILSQQNIIKREYFLWDNIA